jgi:hypothetical protein
LLVLVCSRRTPVNPTGLRRTMLDQNARQRSSPARLAMPTNGGPLPRPESHLRSNWSEPRTWGLAQDIPGHPGRIHDGHLIPRYRPYAGRYVRMTLGASPPVASLAVRLVLVRRSVSKLPPDCCSSARADGGIRLELAHNLLGEAPKRIDYLARILAFD